MQWIIAIAMAGLANSGVSDTLDLKGVVITANHIQELESGTSVDDLGGLLARGGNCYIKQYPGGLGTISYRGMGASHTQVSWNGMRINSATLGQPDLSTLSVGLFDQVQLLSEGIDNRSAINSIGGQLDLSQSKPQGGKSIQFYRHIGAFGQSGTQLGASYKGQNWWVRTRLARTVADNDYTFMHPMTQQQETMDNAGFQRHSAMQSVGWDRNGWALEGHIWAVVKEQQVPATMLEGASHSRQDDEQLRTSFRAKKMFGDHTISAVFGGAATSMKYANPDIGLNALNLERNWQGLLNYQRDWKHASSGARLRSELHRASTDGHPAWHQTSRQFLELYHTIRRERHLIAGAWQLQQIDGAFFAKAGDVHYNWLLTDHLTLHAKANAVYRHPTLNNLYWQPGGNPDLSPEYGKGLELGITREVGGNIVKLTAYSKWVEDWITWLPTSEGYWSPINVAKVWSRGVEGRAAHTWMVGELEITGQTGYALNFVQNIDVSDASVPVGHQLIYAPNHVGSVELNFGYRDYVIRLDAQGASRRYTATDHSSFLQPYCVLNLEVAHEEHFEQGKMTYGGYLRNLTNSEYQLVAWRPMMPRHTGIYIRWFYHDKK